MDDLRPICSEADLRFTHRVLQGDSRYSDVPSSHWGYNLVARATGEKIVSGYKSADGIPLGIFEPDEPIVTAEAFRILFEPEEAYGDHWASAVLTQSKDLGFGQFLSGKAADDTITRLEFVRLLLDRFCIEITDSPIPFRDVPDSGLEHDIVATAYRLGLIRGDGDDERIFQSYRKITRIEAVNIVARAIEEIQLPVALTEDGSPSPARTQRATRPPSSVVPPSPAPPTEPLSTPASPSNLYRVTTYSLTLRSDPVIPSRIISRLLLGDRVTVLSVRSETWAYVRVEGSGQEGYLSRKYIEAVEP
jgi:hypothetical protein